MLSMLRIPLRRLLPGHGRWFSRGEHILTALRSIDVSKVFEDGFTALADINLSIEPGEFVTLLGPSGCGKTTLLKIFAGFYAPTTGRIEQNGADVTNAPPEKRDTAMCFQSYALFPHLTVAENIEFGPRQNKIDRAGRLARVNDLLRQVDLESHRQKLPNKLSGGQQQRVALARALAMRPSVVLFDEPLRIRKCVAPIQALIVPNGCSAVERRSAISAGSRPIRSRIASTRYSCSHRVIRRSFPVAQRALTGQV